MTSDAWTVLIAAGIGLTGLVAAILAWVGSWEKPWRDYDD